VESQNEPKRIEEEWEIERKRLEGQNKQSETFTDPRDGKSYKWVKIGDQVWMAENLAFKPQNGNYWAYDDSQVNAKIFGYLYDWQTACKVCPSGWHLPSDAEWKTLINFLGGDNLAGHKMKSTWAWENGGNGNNVSGFNGLPGGYAHGTFNQRNSLGYWWSSSSDAGATTASTRCLDTGVHRLHHHTNNKAVGFSVRCLKD
jgi:uncharacterized protein (TIGR02145 family)